MTAVALLHKDEIIQRVADGVLLKTIAKDLGVTHNAISQNLANDPEYRAARESGAEARLEKQYEGIEAAEDQLTLARAREGFRAASWFAEREFPGRWGQKTHVTVEHSGALADKLRSAEREIEGERVAETPMLQSTTPESE